jgi:uncharacterized small protein (DUF1192 family)
MPGSMRSDTPDALADIDGGADDPGAVYREAIALLQDEVARLEQELRWRDEESSNARADGATPIGDEADTAADAGEMPRERAELERLERELAGRDETIGLLLDQLSRVEEAHAADRAEWEHLAGWLAELERRVEGQDGEALLRLEERLAAREQEVQTLRKSAEQERRAGEAQRQAAEAEIARLQAALAQVRAAPAAAGSGGEPSAPGAALVSQVADALRSENRRLRAALEESAKRLAADPAETRDARLGEALNERNGLLRRLEQLEDERKRERHEHAAALAELQAQLSRASLVPRDEGSARAGEGSGQDTRDRDVDLRIRALREHLLEIHQQEADARRRKQLLPRLSRLWSRTGPR